MTAPTRIELASQLDIGHAADLHRNLCATLADGRSVELDGSRVEAIDTAILQLLVSFWRDREDRGVGCAWHGVSAALRRTANLLGLAESLHFPDRGAGEGDGGALV
jgi:anti-anti-sigma regulatory factor